MAKHPEIPGIKPQSIRQALGWLIQNYIKDHAPMVAAIVIAMLLQTAAIVYFTRTVEPLTKAMFGEPNFQMAIVLAITIFVTFLIRGLTSMVHRAGTEHVMSKATADLRRDLVTHLSQADFKIFDQQNQGDITAKIGNNINEVRHMMASTLSASVLGVFTVIGLSIFLISVNLYLALIMIAAFGVVGIILGLINRYIRRVREQALGSFSELSTELDGYISNQKSIRLNNLARWAKGRLEHAVKRADLAARRHGYLLGILAPLTDVTIGLAIAFVVLVSFAFLSDGQLEASAMTAFFAALLQLYSPIKRVTNLGATLKALSVTIGSIRWIFDLPIESDTTTKSEHYAPIADIAFDNVTFSYPGGGDDKSVLDNFSLNIPANKLTMIVGKTGSGKSTVPSILLGLYGIESGDIRIGGNSLTHQDRIALRHQSSFVGQEIILLNESAQENLEPFVSPASPVISNILDRLSLSQVEVIDNDQPLGARGSKLSGGQRQRMAIAQALVANRPLAIFDEPTSALDPAMAHRIVSTIKEMREGLTTIMIVHDPALLDYADQVINLDQQ